MKQWTIFFFLLTFLLIFSLNVIGAPAVFTTTLPEEPKINFKTIEKDILKYINQERSKRKLEPFKYSQELSEVAQEWADHMAQKQKMAHRKTLMPILKKYNWRKMNENLFYSESTFPPSFVVECWMKSPPHRKNLLMSDITDAGIGIAQAKNGNYYVCFNGANTKPPQRIHKWMPVYADE